MLRRITSLLALGSISLLAAEDKLEWKALPDLPGDLGVAGPFAGVHNDALIVAGGANFPDGVPWRQLADGSTPAKVYHDTIHVLTRDGLDYTIAEAKAKLPRALGYGVSIPTADGVLCIGGEWREGAEKHRSAKVFALGFADGKIIVDEKYPPLPAATAAAAGALVGETVYVAGGDSGEGATKNFWALDLAKRGTDDFGWVALPPWDGPARTHLLASTQNDGATDCLYIFSGRMMDSDGRWHMLSDAHKFNPKSGEWKKIHNIQLSGDARPRCVMAGTVVPIGANHLLVFGGANGKRFITLTGLGEQIAAAEAAGNAEAAATLKAEQQSILDNHVGFSRDVLLYNAVTDRWTRFTGFTEGSRSATAPGITERVAIGSHVTTTAVPWGDSIIIPTGESSPGIRTPNIWRVDLAKTEKTFGTVNWIILVTYMAVLVGMGVWFSRRSKTIDDFFVAGKRVVWWAAGLSIFSTQLSAITFLSIPARAFSSNWTWLILNLTIPLMVPLIVFCFLPFYRRLNITSVYEYLEMRFSAGLRKLGSASFAVFQLCRMGIVILLPAMALSAVTGWDVRWCIVAMGVLSTLYTVLGGIEAVIWTDVLQTVVLLGGAFAALLIIVGQVDGGWSAIFQSASGQGKLDMVQTEWNFSKGRDTIWVILIGGIFSQILAYGTDQAVVQRYLTTPTEKDAAKAIWTNGLLCIPASVLFFCVGTALFVYFQQQPAQLGPIAKADQIFPHFIFHTMPPGLAGLVIAGVFAAAMSSLDSSMHSIATAVTTDFLSGAKTDKAKLLRTAKWITFALGVLGTVSALIIAGQDNKSLWETLMAYIGLILGTLGGLFTLAIFTSRTAAVHAWVGVVATALVLWYVKFHTETHSLLYGAIGTVTCFAVGLAASYVLPAKPKNLDGLTWASRKPV
jgi:SSS family solute:Na+ symporter